jgi:Fe(3+) dicitrate transport protein
MFGSAHNVSLRLAHTYVPVARFEGVRFSGVSGFGSRSVSGNRLPYSAEHVVSLGMGYAHPAGVELLAEVAHTGAQFADDLNTVAPTPDGQRGVIPASAVWNTTLNYRMRVATIFVSAKNVFDRTFIVDRSRGILPSSPRLVHAGLTVRFQ